MASAEGDGHPVAVPTLLIGSGIRALPWSGEAECLSPSVSPLPLFFETASPCVTQAGLKFSISLHPEF